MCFNCYLDPCSNLQQTERTIWQCVWLLLIYRKGLLGSFLNNYDGTNTLMISSSMVGPIHSFPWPWYWCFFSMVGPIHPFPWPWYWCSLPPWLAPFIPSHGPDTDVLYLHGWPHTSLPLALILKFFLHGWPHTFLPLALILMLFLHGWPHTSLPMALILMFSTSMVGPIHPFPWPWYWCFFSMVGPIHSFPWPWYWCSLPPWLAPYIPSHGPDTDAPPPWLAPYIPSPGPDTEVFSPWMAPYIPSPGPDTDVLYLHGWHHTSLPMALILMFSTSMVGPIHPFPWPWYWCSLHPWLAPYIPSPGPDTDVLYLHGWPHTSLPMALILMLFLHGWPHTFLPLALILMFSTSMVGPIHPFPWPWYWCSPSMVGPIHPFPWPWYWSFFSMVGPIHSFPWPWYWCSLPPWLAPYIPSHGPDTDVLYLHGWPHTSLPLALILMFSTSMVGPIHSFPWPWYWCSLHPWLAPYIPSPGPDTDVLYLHGWPHTSLPMALILMFSTSMVGPIHPFPWPWYWCSLHPWLAPYIPSPCPDATGGRPSAQPPVQASI